MRRLVDNIKTGVTEIGRDDAEQGLIGYEGDDPSFDSRQGLQNVKRVFGASLFLVYQGISLEERRLEYRAIFYNII